MFKREHKTYFNCWRCNDIKAPQPNPAVLLTEGWAIIGHKCTNKCGSYTHNDYFDVIWIMPSNQLFTNWMFCGRNLMLLHLNNRCTHTHAHTQRGTVMLHCLDPASLHTHIPPFFSSGLVLVYPRDVFFWSGMGWGSRQRQIQSLRIKLSTNTWFSCFLTSIYSAA